MKPRPCVRCGDAPRDGAAYLCSECIVDPATREEMRRAVEADRNHPRLVLKQAGWWGGWGRAV